MPGCLTRCTSFRTDTIGNAWTDVRGHFGPVVPVGSTIYVDDLSLWTAWATENSIDPLNVVKFGHWLIWKCSYGTNSFGNLATRSRGHFGIKDVFCPYDSNAPLIRTRTWLGLSEVDPLPTRVDHGEHYIKISSRGSSWGLECTYDSCAYLIANGERFFRV